ncbi:MAG: hypothetical protein IJY19_04915 [Ruminococcus sp.]|nr:hypothetical protein [Ruminococcus sp.]
MTDKELHKLKKSELLELLFTMRKEIDLLQTENNDLKQKLGNAAADREILEKIFHAVCPNEKEGIDSK